MNRTTSNKDGDESTEITKGFVIIQKDGDGDLLVSGIDLAVVKEVGAILDDIISKVAECPDEIEKDAATEAISPDDVQTSTNSDIVPIGNVNFQSKDDSTEIVKGYIMIRSDGDGDLLVSGIDLDVVENIGEILDDIITSVVTTEGISPIEPAPEPIEEEEEEALQNFNTRGGPRVKYVRKIIKQKKKYRRRGIYRNAIIRIIDETAANDHEVLRFCQPMKSIYGILFSLLIIIFDIFYTWHLLFSDVSAAITADIEFEDSIKNCTKIIQFFYRLLRKTTAVLGDIKNAF